MPFTLNFTITSLGYTEDMQPGSAKFNSTEAVLQHLVRGPSSISLLSNFLPTLLSLRAMLLEDTEGSGGRQAQIQNLVLPQTSDLTLE